MNRREFITITSLTPLAPSSCMVTNQATSILTGQSDGPFYQPVSLQINGKTHEVTLDTRATLLDTLRERLGLTGTKKGCNHGACGACTVHINGLNVNSCLQLAITCQGKAITTIEGIASGDELHPMQQAFITHDGLQCGYCTSGQIMSAIVVARDGHADTDNEIRELMSGNICRCGAYNGIVEAVQTVKQQAK